MYLPLLRNGLIIGVLEALILKSGRQDFFFFYILGFFGDFFDAYRALRVLKSADVILSEDTRHSGKLLHYYNIKTPLVSHFWVMLGAFLRVLVCVKE